MGIENDETRTEEIVAAGGAYHDATDTYLRIHGGHGPKCRKCGQEKHPVDDHGRFGCMNFSCPDNIFTNPDSVFD